MVTLFYNDILYIFTHIHIDNYNKKGKRGNMYDLQYEEIIRINLYFYKENLQNALNIYKELKNIQKKSDIKEEIVNQLKQKNFKMNKILDILNIYKVFQDNCYINIHDDCIDIIFKNIYLYKFKIDEYNNKEFLSNTPEEREKQYLLFVNILKDILENKEYIFDYEPEIISSNLDEDLICVEEYERGNLE